MDIFKSRTFSNKSILMCLGFSAMPSTSKAPEPKPAKVVAKESDSSDGSDIDTGFISVSKKKKRKVTATEEKAVSAKKTKVDAVPLI